MPPRRVGVVGLGYVGQPLVATLASVGYAVIGMDINEQLVARLAATYQPTIYEPGLTEAFARYRDRISFTASYEVLMRDSEAICITVGTPLDGGNGSELSSVNAVATKLGSHLRPGHIIILRSTVSPGTTGRLAASLEAISGLRAGHDFFVSFTPERTIEGVALYELSTLPVIVGGINAESTQRTVEIFQRVVNKVIPVSSPLVAELCKLSDNMYRALNIAFANELGELCERIQVDAYEVVQAVNSAYPRTNIFRPGLGAGGPCLSKDPLILRNFAESLQVGVPIIESTAETSLVPVRRIVREVRAFLDTHALASARIALLGLAFKGVPETDDLRGSAAGFIYDDLSDPGSNGNHPGLSFSAYDPMVGTFNGIPVLRSVEECLQACNVVLLLNDHPSLRNIPLDLLLDQAGRPLLIVDVWHNIRRFDRERLPPDVAYIRIGDGS